MKLPSEGRSSAKVSPLSLLKQPSPLMQPQCVTPRPSGRNSSSTSVSPIQGPVKVAKGDTNEPQSYNKDNDNGVSFALPESTAQADTVAEHNKSHQSGRSRRRAAKKEEKKSKAAAAAVGKNDSVSSSSAAMTSEALGLTAIFSRVELSFGFSTTRTSTSHSNTAMLYPRDIANLLLWSVPCAVPLIEAPRFVFVKNRSRVRNVVMIYVNGWSYDMLMCTGAGLPRPTSQPAPSTVNDNESEKKNAGDAASASEGVQPWNERICAALLGPVRCGQCWARGALGNLSVATHSSTTSSSTSSTGVQYAPVLLPSMKNTLEQDIFWRTDRPRVPNSRGTASGKSSIVKQGSGTDATYPVPAETTVRGAGALFKRARAIVEGQSGTTEGDDTSVEETKTTTTKNATESTSVNTQEEDWVRLWQDRTTLMAHALHISQYAEVLQALGFTLQAPNNNNNNSNEWRRFIEKLPDEDGTTSSEGPVMPKVYAFDCEMVLVEGQVSALARATLVNVATRRVVLDWLVKPREPVVDYLTRYSGVDEAMLASVTTTLSDVQDALLKYIDSSNTIVVGHSLENDFEACKLIPNCYLLDTAWLYPHPAGLPYKNSLRFLAMRYLNRRIQDGSHDSCVDALTSAELAFLKLLHGPTFGIQESVSVLGLMTEAASATLHVRLRLFDEPTTLQSMLPNNKKAAKATTQFDTDSAVSSDTGNSITDGKASFFLDAVPIRHDEDATRKVVRSLLLSREQQEKKKKSDPQASTASEEKKGSGEADTYTFTWVQLRETTVDVLQHNTKPHADDAHVDENTSKDVKEGDTAASYEAKQLAAVEATNRRVLRIVEACADDTIIVLVAAVCKGQAGGNHFSRAQGACFAWVKDATAPGPAEDYLHPVTHSNSAEAGRHAATIDTPPACNTQ